ncbi:MAG: secretion system X translation initiation factor, partial [Rhodocyclaceae bacterium]|nr:secretion system X translation initiation factor [Rhodocyclaceae bacterium]
PASFEPPPPPPPKVVAAPPPRPVPPPLPFRYVGRLVEDGVARIFVLRGNATLMVAAGQVIDDQWKVERIGAGDVSFIYLPLGESVTMPARSSE